MSSRDGYRVSGNTLEEIKSIINFHLQSIANRLDQIEGVRGTPTFASDVNVGSNRLTALADPVDNTDAATKGGLPTQDLETTDSPTFVGLILTGALTVATTLEVTGTSTLGNVTMGDAKNIALNTSTGTKIGTASTQKLGFLGATPVVRQSKINDPSGGATQDAQARAAINSIIDVLEAFGLSATS